MPQASANGDPREIHTQLLGGRRSPLAKYRDLVVGDVDVGRLIVYEVIVTLCSGLPGALGLFLRNKLYPLLLGAVGRNVHFGVHVALRHPRKITIGDNVVIDDNVLLDAKGTTNRGIQIGTGVFIGRNTILSCQNGDIGIGDGANVGFNCEIFSASRVTVGSNVLMAAYTYLVGGTHSFEGTDMPIALQERQARGVDVGDNTWIGAQVVVSDGTRIGRECIVGAGAVVNHDVPDWHIAAGVPARLIKDRRATGGPDALPRESP